MSYFIYQDKRVFYTELGEGAPCLFLHGNTASSRMFEPLLPLYQPHMKVILLDFLGNGQSDRISAFPQNLWGDQGHQVVELCRHLGYPKVHLAGTSGGAYAAINAALEAPELFGKVVADSFDGSALPPNFAAAILAERRAAKADPESRGFYQWCQGDDWETVVDQDTQVLVGYEKNHIPLFPRPIESIRRPLLITVSMEDEMLSGNIAQERKQWREATSNITCRIFETGAHPLIYSRAEELAEMICRFLAK